MYCVTLVAGCIHHSPLVLEGDLTHVVLYHCETGAPQGGM